MCAVLADYCQFNFLSFVSFFYLTWASLLLVKVSFCFCPCIYFVLPCVVAFSALILLVGQQEGHWPVKN